MEQRVIVSVLSACLVGSACGDCVDIGASALSVTVVDTRTSQSVLIGATIVAISETSRDSVTVPPTFTGAAASLACCHGGNFTVIVRRPGYLETTRENVFVEEGSCSRPKNRLLEFRLTPL